MPNSYIVDHEYLEAPSISNDGTKAVYHAYIIAKQSAADANAYSFHFDCAWGKENYALQRNPKPETSYAKAKRQFEDTVEKKRKAGNDRTYTPKPGIGPELNIPIATGLEKARIVNSSTRIEPASGPDQKTLDAISKPTWIGVLTEAPMVNLVCHANTLDSHKVSTVGQLSEAVKNDARTISGGIELFGYELNEIFYVANVNDANHPSNITGERLQKFAILLKKLEISNIKLCKFAVNEERKREIVANATPQKTAIFIAADKPANHQIIKYPN